MTEMKKMNQFVQTEGLRTENASTQTDEEEVANQVTKKNFLHLQTIVVENMSNNNDKE